MNDALIVTMLSVVPKGLGSRLQGAFGRTGLSRLIIDWYAKRYQVNLDEMVGKPSDYDSLQDFFVRELKPGMRPVDPAPEALVSPCDGRIYAFGTLQDNGHLPDSAGIDFDVTQLVGDDGRYKGGEFAVIYLSPKDYHRVHHPMEGEVVGLRYLPGALWPVFDEATKRIPGLFAVNERLVVFQDSGEAGRIAVVMVGAYGVGRMSTAHGDIVTNTGGPAASTVFNPTIPVERAQELGRFNLGSTVILVAEPGKIKWELEVGQVVKLGERIGRLASAEAPVPVSADDATEQAGEE